MSVALLGVAYVTEINEFLICGVFLLCLVVSSWSYAGLGGIAATIDRSVAPGRLTVGDLCRGYRHHFGWSADWCGFV